MGEASQQGWFTDPYRRHEARWLSDGKPTMLVRDQGVETYDDPPDAPVVGPALRMTSAKPCVAELLPSTKVPVAAPQVSRRIRTFLTTEPGLDFNVDLMIGIDEKHHVSYDWSQFSGLTTILVDGIEILRKHKLFMFFRTKWRYEVWIGTTEVHRLAVEQTIPWSWGGIRVHTFRFFVDDVLVWIY